MAVGGQERSQLPKHCPHIYSLGCGLTKNKHTKGIKKELTLVLEFLELELTLEQQHRLELHRSTQVWVFSINTVTVLFLYTL